MMKNPISLRKIFFNLCLFLCVYYIGFTFIAASLDKIINPHEFSESIRVYKISPYWGNNLVAIILPWVELICGILLLYGLYCFFSSKSNFIDVPNNIIIVMLIWFIFILSIAVYRGLDIDCGCGISEDKTTPLERLIEDIYLLITSFIIKFRLRIIAFLNRKD